MTISSTDAQIAAVSKRLETLAGRLKQPTIANKAASIALYGRVIRNFDQQGAMDGKWAPLAASTIKQKAKLGKEQMLVRTGHLRAGFVPFHDAHNAGVRNEVTYAKFHHEGTSRLPKRNLLPSRAAVIDIGIKVYGHYVHEWAKEANA